MKYEVKILTNEDEEYPNLLQEITNPPKKLYILGNIDNLKMKNIAIIGSRVCSEKGRRIAKEFSYKLAKMGFCIVSGMAKGIDTAAHIGALNAGGKTIAVLGCGFKNIFPKENKELFERILGEQGTVVSEYPIDVVASSEKFIQRNRIISGLSLGVLVIEAKSRSGTSITAQYAKRQNRKVFCIAHDLDDNNGEGTNMLIKKGAYLVTEISDITKKFGFVENKKIQNISTEKEVPKQYIEIYKCIKNNINTTDQIVKKLKINIKDINYALTMLELENFIYKIQGEFHIR